jgi:intraflagellar transport protein 81
MKKKEQKTEELKKLEVEKKATEKQLQQMEENYAKQKGTKYMKRDDFRQYAANLRVKNTQYKAMVKALDEIKSEVSVLFRTQAVLKSRAENVDEFMAELEQKKGIVGYSKIDE